MPRHRHLQLLGFVTIAWLLFRIAGLPDYYRQYSTKFIILFDLAILPPIWLIIYRSVKTAAIGREFTVAMWWAFYISFPLFLYDFLYCAIYQGHGLRFLWTYWYLTVYYILPWLVFPPTGWLVAKRRESASV